MSRPLLRALCLLATACVVSAAGVITPATAAAPSLPVESVRLMEVTGKVVIGVTGEVSGVEITSELKAPLRDALLAQARGWKFKPISVQGQPSVAQAAFRLVLAATKNGDDYLVRMDGIDFGDGADKTAVVPDGTPAEITGKLLSPPQYPPELMKQGHSGGVLVAILVGADGRPEQVQVVQSLAHDFTRHGSDGFARRVMKSLEYSAVAAARRWTFNVPPSLATAPPEQRTVVVPIVYIVRYDVSKPGYWIPVLRGPRNPANWLPPERTGQLAFGTGGSGAPVGVDSPYRMLTPIGGTTLH
jgi:hypothetical protein